MKVNIERMKRHFYQVGEIGKDSDGGITRLAFSNEYKLAADKLKEIMNEADLKVETDSLYNIYGHRNGDKYHNYIMFGSHLDTVKNGGLFDGLLGIMAGLECINVLNENSYTTKHPLKLIAFNAEEGGELGGTFGSRGAIGLLDKNNKDFNNRIKKFGLNQEDIEKAQIDPRKIAAFLEMHISQEKSLESNNTPIGIVKSISGISRYKLKILGESDHAGTTRMNNRNDALVKASKIILFIEEKAKEIGDSFVATVGDISVAPGEYSIIPGTSEIKIETRAKKKDSFDEFIKSLKGYLKLNNLIFELENLITKPPIILDEEIINIIKDRCIENNIEYSYMHSGAGHDAKTISKKIPTGLFFIPSKNGISHSPEEFTSWEDIKVGTQLMLNTILYLDKIYK